MNMQGPTLVQQPYMPGGGFGGMQGGYGNSPPSGNYPPQPPFSMGKDERGMAPYQRRISVYTSNLGTPNVDGPIKGGLGGGVMGLNGVVNMSPKYNLSSGYNRAEYKNLTKERFLSLDPDTVCQILSDDGLSVLTEVECFIAAWKWLSVDPVGRKKHLKKLMSCVRFPLFTARELYMAARELKTFPETWEFIFNANWYHSCVEYGRPDSLFFTVPKQRLYYGVKRADPFSLMRTQIGFAPTLENWRSFEMNRGAGGGAMQQQQQPYQPRLSGLGFQMTPPPLRSPDTVNDWMSALREATRRLKELCEDLNGTTRRSMYGAKIAARGLGPADQIRIDTKASTIPAKRLSPLHELSKTASSLLTSKRSSMTAFTTEPSSSDVSEIDETSENVTDSEYVSESEELTTEPDEKAAKGAPKGKPSKISVAKKPSKKSTASKKDDKKSGKKDGGGESKKKEKGGAAKGGDSKKKKGGDGKDKGKKGGAKGDKKGGGKGDKKSGGKSDKKSGGKHDKKSKGGKSGGGKKKK